MQGKSAGFYYALMVVTLVFWSNSFTAIEAALQYLSPLELLAARYLPVGIFCTAYMLWRWRDAAALLREAGWKIAVMGLMSVASYNIFLNIGQTHVSSGTAAILVATNPLQTYILAMLFLGERPSWRRTAGILVAFAGLYVVIVYGSHKTVNVPYIQHAVLTLLAPFSWALYTLTGKKLMAPGGSRVAQDPLLITYTSLALGCIPAYAFLGGDFASHALTMPWQGWFSVFYLAVFCTLFGFYTWTLCLKHLTATVTSSFVYLNPPLAVISAAVFLGHPVKPPLIAGLALVLAGIFLTTRKVSPAPVAPQE